MHADPIARVSLIKTLADQERVRILPREPVDRYQLVTGSTMDRRVVDELVGRRASSREMREAAARAGFRTLVDDGMRRVLDGVTTLEEVARVADLTDRLQ